MKINICYKFKKISGGGNQFLKILRNSLSQKKCYEKNINNADIILVNSHENIFKAIKHIIKNPNIKVIHRIDGPMKLYNHKFDFRDNIIYHFSKYFADACIFQSNWSKNSGVNKKIKQLQNTVISNCVDKNIYYPKNKAAKSKKINLVSVSWSSNIKKGFKTYKWLDEHLDFKKFNYTFIGNSPFKFSNIKMIEPLKQKELAKELKNNNIYITASKNDPCSNSLIEAINSGLIPFGLKSGGHPEIINNKNYLFKNKKELITKLNNIHVNWDKIKYKNNLINNKSLKQYYEFIKHVKRKKKKRLLRGMLLTYSSILIEKIITKCIIHIEKWKKKLL